MVAEIVLNDLKPENSYHIFLLLINKSFISTSRTLEISYNDINEG